MIWTADNPKAKYRITMSSLWIVGLSLKLAFFLTRGAPVYQAPLALNKLVAIKLLDLLQALGRLLLEEALIKIHKLILSRMIK